MSKNRLSFFLIFLLILALVVPLSAQDAMGEPSVEVSDQVSLDGTVTITSAYSDGPGFVVIHIDNGSGAPGPVIGYAALNPGWNYNIPISIDTSAVTPMIFAMLHTDTGEVGVYEFGTVEGADGPVRDGAGSVITPGFNVDVIAASDQLLEGSTVTIDSVVAQADGWLVIHSDNDGAPGPVLGQTQVSAGVNQGVAVELSNDVTSVLWPMLHVDTGEIGVYEFGTVQGADGPVRVNGVVAVTPLWTVPHMRVADQVVTPGDNMDMEGTPSVVAHSVLAEVDGWLVIHSDNDGAPGPVLGQTQVSAGLNQDVVVELSGDITPVLWPMLHVDTGEVGVYEFGTVEGADGPVRVNEQVVTFPINAAPSIDFNATLDGSTLTIPSAVIDAPGWMAIHSNADGRPGPVIGNAPLRPGLNSNITISLSEEPGPLVFPMLHYDTGEAGVYEFGTVEGADGPVRVGESVVVGPANLGGEEASAPADTSSSASGACAVSAAQNVNLRTGPNTTFAAAGTLTAGQSADVAGQAQGSDGYSWWNLADGTWVRSDIVTTSGDCGSVPSVAAPEAPAAPADPTATEEASS